VQGFASIALLALVENGMSLVVFAAVALSLIVALVFMLSPSRGESMYERIGAGGISREEDYARTAPAAVGDSAAQREEREREIRQMLSARSERLVRNGQPALDVEAELTRLLAGASSPEGERTSPRRDGALVSEVRQLVLARNERRARRGMEPLDVEAEVARTLDELGG
jgi:hypothetical protein